MGCKGPQWRARHEQSNSLQVQIFWFICMFNLRHDSASYASGEVSKYDSSRSDTGAEAGGPCKHDALILYLSLVFTTLGLPVYWQQEPAEALGCIWWKVHHPTRRKPICLTGPSAAVALLSSRSFPVCNSEFLLCFVPRMVFKRTSYPPLLSAYVVFHLPLSHQVTVWL